VIDVAGSADDDGMHDLESPKSNVQRPTSAGEFKVQASPYICRSKGT
jgi:hypothetical protein